MVLDKTLDNILNTCSKVKIIRLFASKNADFAASGRHIARLANITAPTAHAALKELRNQGILKRNIIGRQHIYRLNDTSKIVKQILKPMFQKENSILRF